MMISTDFRNGHFSWDTMNKLQRLLFEICTHEKKKWRKAKRNRRKNYDEWMGKCRETATSDNFKFKTNVMITHLKKFHFVDQKTGRIQKREVMENGRKKNKISNG